MFSLQNGLTPTQNEINQLTIRNTIANPQPIVTRSLTFASDTYTNSTMDSYEEYQSTPFLYKENGYGLAVKNIAIVKSGSLVTLCFENLDVVLAGGQHISTDTGIVPNRFIPGLLVSGSETEAIFPILVKNNNVQQVGTLKVLTDGSMHIYAAPNDTNFSAGSGGFYSSYVSWIR